MLINIALKLLRRSENNNETTLSIFAVVIAVPQ